MVGNTVLEQLCASPFRQRGQQVGLMLHERFRGLDKPLAPSGLGIYSVEAAGGDVDEDAGQIVVQTPLVRGQSRLFVTALAGVGSRDALRVAYSLAMLLEKGLVRSLGAGGLKASLRAQQYGIETRMMTFGMQLKGGSVGVVAFLGMVQSMTECAFFEKMSSTGAISLTGRIGRVDGIRQKVEGALREGQREVLLPEANRPSVLALPAEVAAAMQFVFVSNVAQALRSAVVGWRRRMTLPLPTLDVASMDLPMTYEGSDWLMVVEAAVVPGHGEVHITGNGDVSLPISEGLRAAVLWARTYQEQIVQLMQVAAGGAVQQVVDLVRMRYTAEHPWAADALRPVPGGAGGPPVMEIPDNSLDLHIHLPTTSFVEVESGYSAALGVLLASLLTEVLVPRVAVVGVCEHSGLLGVIFSDSNQRLWQVAEHLGVEKLVLNHQDYDRSLKPEFGGPMDMTRVPALREVFSP